MKHVRIPDFHLPNIGAIVLVAIAAVCGFLSTCLLADDGAAAISVGSVVTLNGRKATVTKLDSLPFIENGYTKRFKYDSFTNPKLKQLRQRYKLDDVVAPGKTEFDRQVLLLDWVNRQFKKFGAPTANPRGAAEILQDISEGHTFFCAQYADVFVSTAASLGWIDRSLALRRPNNVGSGSTEHSSTEIWSNQYRKWIMLDPTFAMYVEKDSLPLSAYEIRQEWFEHEAKNIAFVLGKDRRKYHKSDMPIFRGRFPGFGDLSLDGGALNPYAFIGWVPNTDLMDSGPDYGKMFIFKDKLCDGTSWHIRDLPKNLATDAYFPIGQATIALSADGDFLEIDLKTLTPNFKSFSVRIDGGEWKPSPGAGAWDIHPGKNRLEAKTVNLFGVEGPVSTAEIEVKADAPSATPAKPTGPLETLKAIGAEITTGDDGFISINFPAKSKVTDADLAHLDGLSKVRGLGLNGSSFTDAGFVHLAGLTDLHGLSVAGTKITDRGFSNLKGLTELQSLTLSDTAVTGEGLANLANSTKLEFVFAQKSQFNDAGMAQLKAHRNLRRLFLDGTKITDAGLANLSGFKQIECLLLDDTQITDAGLAHLKDLQSLRYLWLRKTKVTDAGLDHLKRLVGLKSLKLAGTNVTDHGLSELQKVLTKCAIEKQP